MAYIFKQKYVVCGVLILSIGVFVLTQIPFNSISKTNMSSTSTQYTFYKWQDADGMWHLSDNVPEGVEAQPVQVDTATNILKPVAMPVISKTPDQTSRASDHDDEQHSPIIGLPFSVNPADIPKIIEQAKNVEQTLNDRAARIDAAQ